MSPFTGVSVAAEPKTVCCVLVLQKVFLLSAEFHIIVCGLDSIIARRWMNGMLVGVLSRCCSPHQTLCR